MDQQQQQQQQQQQPQNGGGLDVNDPLTDDEVAELSHFIDTLVGTKESIKVCSHHHKTSHSSFLISINSFFFLTECQKLDHGENKKSKRYCRVFAKTNRGCERFHCEIEYNLCSERRSSSRVLSHIVRYDVFISFFKSTLLRIVFDFWP
jgi:hypothetical protein